MASNTRVREPCPTSSQELNPKRPIGTVLLLVGNNLGFSHNSNGTKSKSISSNDTIIFNFMLQIYKLPMPIGNGIITKQICSSALLWTSYCLQMFKAPLGPMPKGIGIIRKKIGPNEIFEFHTSEFKLHLGPCQWATVQIARTFVLMLQMYKLYLAPCP